VAIKFRIPIKESFAVIQKLLVPALETEIGSSIPRELSGRSGSRGAHPLLLVVGILISAVIAFAIARVRLATGNGRPPAAAPEEIGKFQTAGCISFKGRQWLPEKMQGTT
jgi:hypothetical protein